MYYAINDDDEIVASSTSVAGLREVLAISGYSGYTYTVLTTTGQKLRVSNVVQVVDVK
jgi:hypothetical protein